MTVRGGSGPREPMAHRREDGGSSPGGAPRPGSGARRANGGDGGSGSGANGGAYRGPSTYESGYERIARRRNRRYERYEGRGGFGGLLRFLAFLFVLAAIVLVALATVARPILAAVVVPLAEDNRALLSIGFVDDLVRDDIGAALTTPASSDPSEVEFRVDEGDTPATLARRLVDEELVRSDRAFLYEARHAELATQLKAGWFMLRRDMTPREVVVGLIENEITIRTVPVTFREGLRLEQLTAKLQTVEGLPFDPREFYELVTSPPAVYREDYPFLATLPEGASLEGFLYPATYTVRIDPGGPTTADGLVRAMLDEFAEQVGAERTQVPEARGLTFYQVLTLASIVEREAVVDEERPTIAGVYQNRLDRVAGVKHGLLQADPTVIYANDTVELGEYGDWTQYLFWDPKKIDGPYAELELPEALRGYNSYAVRGLPPGPIVSPSLASIEAALEPEKTDFKFFLAIPDGDGRHVFAKTIDEHEQNKAKYGY